MRRSVRRVWFLVVPRTGLLNVAGPWEVLGHANDLLGRDAYELELVGPSAPSAEMQHGLRLGGIRRLPGAGVRLPDIAIVAGGSPLRPLPAAQASLVAWLRRHRARIPTIVSICTGAFVLGEAGILDGHRATTHWLHLEDLRSRFPAARVVDDGIFVREEGLWTSAGLTAGIDLTLAMVEEHHGHGVAMAVAKRMVLFLRRSGNQAQFSSTLRRQEEEPSKLADVSTFVLEHLDESLPVERIAAGIGMSARTLNRWCRQHLHESPAELVRRLRIDEARRLLEETPLPLKDIATRAGLGDASTMWRGFTQRLGVTPAEYRQRFASASASAGTAAAEG
jgi:transcriptional regulator GlxA family with amidase domain